MKRFSGIVHLAILLGLAVPALAQMKPATQGPAPGITRPDSIQDSNMWEYWTNMSGQGRAGGALLGKVNVEGEPLLWNPILVSVVCDGSTVSNTQTDPNGKFLISFAPARGSLSLQNDQKRQMETHYEGCTVQAAFTGFHSGSVTITARNLRDDPDLGTITLSRAGGRSAATAVSETTDAAPENARKEFDKARTDLLEQKADRAQHDLEKAVQADPSFAEAWFQLGKLQEAANSSAANSSFSKSAAADPNFILPYEQLANLAMQAQNWRDVVGNTNHALQLDPAGTVQTWYLNALGNFHLGKADAAQASAVKALDMDPSHTLPNTEQLLAVILAAKGDYPSALAHLRNCLTYVPDGPSADLLKQQIKQLQRKIGVSK